MTKRNPFQETKDKPTEVKSTLDSMKEMERAVPEPSPTVAQTPEGLASDVRHKAQDWAANVADKAQETASAAVDQTNAGIASIGHQLNALGDTARPAGPRAGGAISSAATTVADKLQAGGRYLEEHGLAAMGTDLTSFARRYPVQTALVGFGLGCLLGMTLRRR